MSSINSWFERREGGGLHSFDTRAMAMSCSPDGISKLWLVERYVQIGFTSLMDDFGHRPIRRNKFGGRAVPKSRKEDGACTHVGTREGKAAMGIGRMHGLRGAGCGNQRKEGSRRLQGFLLGYAIGT